MTDVRPMSDLLQRWSELLLADVGVGDRPTRAARESGSLLRPPATEEQVGALETRLGRRLPPSYREFLLLSDGAYGDYYGASREILRDGEELAPAESSVVGVGFLPCADVRWLRDVRAWEADLYADTELDADDEGRTPITADGDEPWPWTPMADGLVIATDKAPGTTCLVPVDGAGEWQVWNIHKETSVGYLSFRSFLEHEVAIREPVATLAEARSLVERANLGDRVATWRLSRVTADDAVPFLVELMDGQWEHAAARSLSRIGTSEAMDALVRSGSRTAVRALMWDGSERARDALAECRAVVELSLLGDPRGVELAVREIEERDPAISGDAELTRLRTAVGVLGRSREPRFAEVLLPLRFGDTEKESALSVALALIELRVPDGRTRLAELAASDDAIGGRARYLLQRVDDGYLA